MQDKLEAMKRLKKAIEEGKVDEDILDLLDLINSIEGLHTTSSCSGRIGIMETPEIGAKPKAKWLLKEHRPVSLDEVMNALNAASSGLILFKVQPPILHIVCKDVSLARRVHHCGLQAGFKYTTYKVINHVGRVLVEINTTENLSVPLGKDGRVLVNNEYLEFLVKCANAILDRAKKKLDRLRKEIKTLKMDVERK